MYNRSLLKLTVAAFEELLESADAPERIICLGLGSLVEGESGGKRISEVQLALLIELRKLVDVPRKSIYTDYRCQL